MINGDYRPRGVMSMRGAVLLISAVALMATTTGCSMPAGTSAVDPPGSVSATVVKVVDGDTVHVTTPSGPEVVRVLGIDTPETVKPNSPVACGGPEATRFARGVLLGKQVTLIADPSQDD